MSVAYGSRPTSRRTREDVEAVRQAIRQVLEKDYPMTVRQVFYQLVGLKAIGKTETEYKHTVVRLLSEMRRSGDIPFYWIADSTQWMRKPTTFSSLEAALKHTAEAFRRSQWDSQDTYVEVWLEKDALAGVLVDVTGQWDVPLMVTRGYSSISFLYSAAESLRNLGKVAYIYYLGDYDPSGLDITRTVEKGLRELAPDVEIHFERLAVTPSQIRFWDLPTRPTKATDSRASRFVGESVEVDAVPSPTLRALVSRSIEQHVDKHALHQLKKVEDLERLALRGMLALWTFDSDKDVS